MPDPESAAARCTDRGSGHYERHRPETTVLYRVVEAHLEEFLEAARERHGRALPRYVERELRAYLACGRLEHGFARARCDACGRELAVAFSCKKRGVCPSCNARRMSGTAAHLVDHVFPDVPVRQWVLSVPFEIRGLLAAVPAAVTRLDQIFTDEVFRWQRERARELGLPPRDVQSAAITHVQRFGGALNLNVHLHAVACDGVFTRGTKPAGTHKPVASDERAIFHRLRDPTADEVSEIAQNVAHRFLAWCRRRGFVRDVTDREDDSNEPKPTTALEACRTVALHLGPLGSTTANPRGASKPRGEPHPDAPDGPGTPGSADALFRLTRGPACGAYGPWDVHAGVTVPAGDHAGREKLLRYLARAPLSLERMSLLPDGRIAYQLRHAWRADRTHVLLDPMQLMARLAALVPPPRHPLLRFHGAFAPNSSWRKHVVPLEPPRLAQHDAAPQPAIATRQSTSKPACAPSPEPGPGDATSRHRHDAAPPITAARAGPSVNPAAGANATATTKADTPHDRASVRDASYRARWYIDWAMLLRRVYDVDALACPCGGNLKFIEIIDNSDDARAFLATRGNLIDLADNPQHRLDTEAPAPIDDSPWQRAAADFTDPVPDYEAAEPPPDSS